MRAGDHRPLLGDDPEADLAAMAADRAELYASVADVIVDTDGRSPEAVAADVLDHLPGVRGASGGLLEPEELDGPLPHLDLADLAGDGHRELVGEVEVAGDLVVGELARGRSRAAPRS